MKMRTGMIAAMAVIVSRTVLGGGVVTPLTVGITNPVRNELGVVLKGVHPSASAYGYSSVQDEVVQLLKTLDGRKDAPSAGGFPTHANNVVIGTGRIGDGVDPARGPTGLFSTTLVDPPTNGIFCRVFNAKTLEASSFYGESQIFTNPTTHAAEFYPDISGTIKPLDPGDDDADGLINSWEKTLQTDPGKSDTDGDGQNDYAEHLTGTEGTNSASFLGVVQIMANPVGHAEIFWASIPGKSYQVQYAPVAQAGDASAYSNVSGRITADSGFTQFTVTNGLSLPSGLFRVRWIP